MEPLKIVQTLIKEDCATIQSHLAKRRTFTPEFKAEVVPEVLSGTTSQAEVCRQHNLNENQLSQWKRQLLENAVSLFESTHKESSDAKKRIAHLEQFVGRLTVALDKKKP